MAKRYSDTDKWKKPFMRNMEAPYKLLWLYILDECDHAGVWQVDIDVAQLKIGEKLDLKKAMKFFDGKICSISAGEKWFIPDFISFQYGEVLNPENKVHKSVLSILKKYSLLDSEGQIKVHTSPLQGAKDKDKDMDKDKATDKAKEKEGGEPVLKIVSVHAQCQEFYIGHQKEQNRECNWNGRYASDLSDVLKKLKKTYTTSNGREPTDEETVGSFKYLIQKLPTWYQTKSLSIVNSNYDSIINDLKSGKTASTSNRNSKEFHEQRNADQLSKLDGDPYSNKATG